MINTGKKILIKFKKRWQLLLWAEIFLYASGASVLLYFLIENYLGSILIFFLVFSILSFLKKPWQLSLEKVSGYIDHQLESAEYSSGLLLLSPEGLSGLAKLQQQKVARELEEKIKTVKTPNQLIQASSIAFGLIALGFVVSYFNFLPIDNNTLKPSEETEIVFKKMDSTSEQTQVPRIKKQLVRINYPAYTGIPSVTTSKMDIKVLEGSVLTWELSFDAAIKKPVIELMGELYPMNSKETAYTYSLKLNAAGFYNFRFEDTLGASYVSKLYAIEMIKDEEPVVEIQGIDQFTTFEFRDSKKLAFNTLITDDLGVGEAFIIATVSKGSGESVKFREQKMEFDGGFKRGSRKLYLSKSIDLDELKMEAGDELYFYVEASDLKQPEPNRSRSETYFAVIKDTTTHDFAVEGTLGADLMPDYFRSQRQLIIDTEKLIKQRRSLSKKEFNFKSNELGFDQKALRLKYGQFMGDETEGDAMIEHEETTEHNEEEDPLAAYTHDHDGDNEHNLVEEKEEESKTPLEEYLHNHDDLEEATLFSNSLKSMLRLAMTEMWDAELHLRMYKPENSLPFQNRALKLIQEIKNSARIYVHRIGFDPPPIKEEKRLTGKLEEVSSFRKSEEIGKSKSFPFIKKSIQRLEELISNKSKITTEDRQLFKQAGTELAVKAIAEPGNYLKTLQQLKWLAEDFKERRSILGEVQKGLLSALPKPTPDPAKKKGFESEINNLFLKELELNDR
ncbi:hypothetical protein JM83_2677 [Gillisia sp. Hel_I_86]|uniref:tryptophan-rich sensory protein n=1 Tax=Gillisia sp. Hel_I_86 TaxID=1249981 RepID=UPI00119B2331|nr:tryptophan-rich sensory protein [Gillisia sp. Hel_I_86]TVZ27627.1 hypothetical protein JM83_2677 [Gillisia sp. Hel_I_86]